MLHRRGVLPFIFAVNFSSFFGLLSQPELNVYKGLLGAEG
jgi:hypothetical protein